ncbi:MAG: DNA-binding protein [Clostridiales bacterium]|jgi:predicted DNA-binding protein with PD1-like motif|nr:DNA-binding protein [Clostridiales bacterium]
MNMKRFGNTLMLRIDRGEEILACVTKACEQNGIRLAGISAIGAVDHAVVGLYRVEERAYHSHALDGEMELTSLTGNVTTKDGELYLHLHAVLADEQGHAFGGHLNEARVSGTCEMMIQILDGTVGRSIDPKTGLNRWDFSD